MNRRRRRLGMSQQETNRGKVAIKANERASRWKREKPAHRAAATASTISSRCRRACGRRRPGVSSGGRAWAPTSQTHSQQQIAAGATRKRRVSRAQKSNPIVLGGVRRGQHSPSRAQQPVRARSSSDPVNPRNRNRRAREAEGEDVHRQHSQQSFTHPPPRICIAACSRGC